MKTPINMASIIMKALNLTLLSLILTSISFQSSLYANISENHIFNYNARFHPVIGQYGMVASQEENATKVGVDILKRGGNAIDAAVAMGFALAVTLPRAGNIGGGGFMMIHIATDNQTFALDYRETASQKSHRNMFLDDSGEPNNQLSRNSILAVGVPGTVAGLTEARHRFGTFSLKTLLKPAIQLAKHGFVVNSDLKQSLSQAKPRMNGSESAMGTFFKKDASEYKVGETLVQKDLAWSLKQIAKYGKDAFYSGNISKKFVAFMDSQEGLITHEDLKNYQPVWREPVSGSYRGYDIYAMPPPSSGGVHLIQMLRILEGFPIKEMGHNTADTIHVLAETMKLAYADRSKFLGDPEYVSVPVQPLISEPYTAYLRSKIDRSKATKSNLIQPGDPIKISEGNETTHFVVMDRWGNVVSNTYTLNFS
ncbi:MAG: gamma-glutamyltransferase, partial [Candidatus Margulisbacteria bacterium]|nr:gamma-glutamyltransferase [Candidatus Margulisiibacteriota bacterium]